MPPKGFKCKQCGRCCFLSGAFSCAADEEDILMWESIGRNDILQWVDIIDLGEGNWIYDIWISPKTGEDAERCPWLRKLPNKDKYICRIHDVKPRHCRDFPLTIKMAKENGCQGFGHMPDSDEIDNDEELLYDFDKLKHELRVEQVNSIFQDKKSNYVEEMEKIGFTWVDDGYGAVEEFEEKNAKPENNNQKLLVEFFDSDLPITEEILEAFWQEKYADQPNYPLFRRYFKESNEQLKSLILWGLDKSPASPELLSDLSFFHQFQPNLAELIERYMTACKLQDNLDSFTILAQDFFMDTELEGFDAYRALMEIYGPDTPKGAIVEFLLEKNKKYDDVPF